MTEHVLIDKSGGVLTLTLNRPEKKNALTRAMYQALGDAIDGAAKDKDVRCVLIQANGDIFTAGNDLGDFAAVNAGDTTANQAREGGNPLLAALARAKTPLVAAGHARAFSMFVLGEAVDGRTAAAWGIANAAVPAAELRAKARAAAEAVAARPASSVAITKALMRDPAGIATRMDEEGRHFAAQLKSAEAKEAFAAFAQKRAPDFSKVA
jgi:enoyl-CoA hydratase/carnithine racemase